MVASDLVDMHELQQRPNPWRKIKRHMMLRRERAGLLNNGQRSLQGFGGSSKRESFCEEELLVREKLGVQGLRVKSLLVNFFFS